MSDDEIRAVLKQYTPHQPANIDCCEACDVATLADAALARGVEIARLTVYGTSRTCQEWEALAERVAQLETALRWYGDKKHWACDAHSGYCDADLDRGEKARAALAATSR